MTASTEVLYWLLSEARIRNTNKFTIPSLDAILRDVEKGSDFGRSCCRMAERSKWAKSRTQRISAIPGADSMSR